MPEVIRLSTTESTMDVLHALAAEGAEAGTAVLAGEQTGGRGSRGRSWRSPPGGLWLSMLYRPQSAVGVELFGLRVGLLVAEALESLDRAPPVSVKWPNDLMVDDRKLGGILCETRWQGERPAWVVAGVGINVVNRGREEVGEDGIALVERLPGITLGPVETAVTARLRRLRPDTVPLSPDELAGLRARDWLHGRRLESPAAGIAVGISADGALLVRSDQGTVTAVRAGTVELAGRSPTP